MHLDKHAECVYGFWATSQHQHECGGFKAVLFAPLVIHLATVGETHSVENILFPKVILR